MPVSLQERLVRQSINILWHLKADKPQHRVVSPGRWLEKVRGTKWLKSEGERRKKLDVRCAGVLPSSGDIWGLTVLVAGWVVLQWTRHHPSEVEQVGAEVLGWRSTAELGGGPSESWHMPWALCRAVPAVPVGDGGTCRDGWSAPTHHQPSSSSSPATSQKFAFTGFGAAMSNRNFPPDFFPSKDLEA